MMGRKLLLNLFFEKKAENFVKLVKFNQLILEWEKVSLSNYHNIVRLKQNKCPSLNLKVKVL